MFAMYFMVRPLKGKVVKAFTTRDGDVAILNFDSDYNTPLTYPQRKGRNGIIRPIAETILFSFRRSETDVADRKKKVPGSRRPVRVAKDHGTVNTHAQSGVAILTRQLRRRLWPLPGASMHFFRRRRSLREYQYREDDHCEQNASQDVPVHL